ncbi:uncharacterized protein PV07_10978 [Cladophialophora immunda]|uniref:Uncharacterized protein n=1 Tax=Cladophialophora immunda TaxID=569365 RepID=A0A0D1Z507_9EURO|nr:uncharacterized protein PV07_10978 [Cladophialophora immunda]KIW22711.1 hypothetical protein PV07_10978 [Cladophialophora immunda]OQU94089.1 hypothetical protein CLAIMM_00501 [Cladophialophora immunda]
MDLLPGKLGGRRASNHPKLEPPMAVNIYYEQYKTENIQTVYKDYYPSAESSQEEKDLLMERRLEVSKTAERLDSDKKSFTAANHQAAQERAEEGVRCYDWAYARQPSPEAPFKET